MGFRVAVLPLGRNVSRLSYKWEPLQKKELVHWGDTHSGFTQCLTCIWGITRHFWGSSETRKEPPCSCTRKQFSSPSVFLTLLVLKTSQFLFEHGTVGIFYTTAGFLFKKDFWRGEQQAQRCAGVLSPSLLMALCSQISWSTWVLVPRQGAVGSEATPLKPSEMILVLYVMSFKHCLWAQKNTRGMSLGYSHQNTGLSGHSQMPTASHRT